MSGAEGLLLIDKPEGPTSHDVVQAVRKAIGGARAGHAGTLDPFASGLLLVATGRATRLLRFLAASDKTYEGEILLGVATDTDDSTGRPLHEPRPVGLGADALTCALDALGGAIEQIPPAYSARKHGGVRLYRLARAGREVPRRPARARVEWRSVRAIAPDRLSFTVTVSAGTYVRALARDLGEKLGCGGHLASLRRIASGPFHVSEAAPYPPERAPLLAALRPLESIPLGMPTVVLDDERRGLVMNGRTFDLQRDALDAPSPTSDTGGLGAGAVAAPGSGGERWIRLVDRSGRLVGVGVTASAMGSSASPVVHPRVVLV